MFDRILVPLDGSEMAEAVLTQVRRLLFRKDAEVLLVQAIGLPPAVESDLSTILAILQARALEYLNGVGRRLSEQGARVRTFVRQGAPAETILEVAEKEEASLIAMSTHGRSGIARWVLGSVAEKVIRASPIPVLAVRSYEGAAPVGAKELSLKKILVAIDAADLSFEAIPPAIELARLFDARVLLVNVCEGPECAVPVPQMTHAFVRFREAGLTVEPVMRVGDPASGILDACTEHGADLVALSTHGRSGVTRWVLGSVAEKVLRSATVPLLVVRNAPALRGKAGPEPRKQEVNA